MPRRRAIVVTCAVLAGCVHTEPIGVTPPEAEGPRTSTLPRQLTFNPLDDRAPALHGDQLIYGQAPLTADARALCLAVLPVEGGQTLRVACPPATLDTLVHTWDEPAWSPDGSQIAFLWIKSARVSALGALTHELAVAPASDPGAPTRRLELGGTLPDGRKLNSATQPRWVDDRTVRFVAAWDSIPKVKGGGPTRFTDTLRVPLALRDLDVVTGTVTSVPGGDTVSAWAPAPDGGFWCTLPDDPGLYRVDPTGVRTLVDTVGLSVLTLADVGDGVVAGLATGQVYYLNPGLTAPVRVSIPTAGPVQRIVWDPVSNRLVIAAEPEPSLFGLPADLWLVALPNAGGR